MGQIKRIKNVAFSNKLLLARLFVMIPILYLSLYNVVDFTLARPDKLFQALSTVMGESGSTLAPRTRKDSKSIDIISVGSVLKSTFQDAQQRTFGANKLVRNFYRVTEMSDTDRECFTDLTTDQVQEIIDFCSVTEGESFISELFRNVLFQPKKHSGWVCAQKRPIDGLYQVLQQYREGTPIPEYLFIIDDDTYLNIAAVKDLLYKDFPPEQPQLVTGCNFEFLNPKSAFTYPYGGFGSFLSKRSIERLLQPIDCSKRDSKDGTVIDPFSRLACWRLNLNSMGEKRFFRDGMSVADLMYRFSSEQPFAQVSTWKAGYCFHSDHSLAFFLNFYHIAVPDEEMESNLRPTDRFREQYKYTALTDEQGQGRRGECSNERERCKLSSLVCHYIQPEQMDDLHEQRMELQSRRDEYKESGGEKQLDLVQGHFLADNAV